MRNRLRALITPVLRTVAPHFLNDQLLGRFARENLKPAPPARPDDTPFVPLRFLSTLGIDLYPDEQVARVRGWASPAYQKLFHILRNDPTINTNPFGHGPAAVHNRFFPTPDAEVYAAMILDRRPRRIIEIGSGYSTRIARAAIEYGKCQTELIVVDPSPRADVDGYADRVMRFPVESSAVREIAWSGEDLLFIDSSHVCRIRGDLPFLYCELIPALPAGALVHVHDIFIPYDYPNVYDEYCYTEEYLLFCSLSHTPRYKTLFASHWLSREHGDAMRTTFGPLVGVDPLLFGASYWFSVQRG